MASEDVGWGTALAFLTGTAVVAYTTWKIHRRRVELRETIEPLGEEHHDFVDALEALVADGRLVPVE